MVVILVVLILSVVAVVGIAPLCVCCRCSCRIGIQEVVAWGRSRGEELVPEEIGIIEKRRRRRGNDIGTSQSWILCNHCTNTSCSSFRFDVLQGKAGGGGGVRVGVGFGVIY